MRLSIPIFFFPLISFLPITFAHFEITQPKNRPFDEDKLEIFPCGGQPVSNTRTQIPLNDPKLSITLEMGHDEQAVQILLALGTDPGENFNITLKQTFRQTGLGSFCLPDLPITEAELGTPLRDGMNATLQVVTSGDPNGGLYVCTDLTFSSAAQPPPSDKCKNGTGTTATLFSGDAAARNANESTPDGDAQSGTQPSSSAQPSGTGQPSGSGQKLMSSDIVAWVILGAAVAGGLALL